MYYTGWGKSCHYCIEGPYCGEHDFKQYLTKLEVGHCSPFWGTIITAQKVRLYRKTVVYIYSLTFWAGIMVPHCGELLFKQLKQQYLATLKVDHSSPFWGTIITAQKVRLYRKTVVYIYSLTFWAGIIVPHFGELVFKQLKQNLKLVTVPHCGEQDSNQFLAKLKVDHSSPFWGTIITVCFPSNIKVPQKGEHGFSLQNMFPMCHVPQFLYTGHICSPLVPH